MYMCIQGRPYYMNSYVYSINCEPKDINEMIEADT